MKTFNSIDLFKQKYRKITVTHVATGIHNYLMIIKRVNNIKF